MPLKESNSMFLEFHSVPFFKVSRCGMPERQERMAKLMAHEDVSSLRLCDIVTRANYSELKKVKNDVAEKKKGTGQGQHERVTEQPTPPRRQFQEVQEPQVLAPQVTVRRP